MLGQVRCTRPQHSCEQLGPLVGTLQRSYLSDVGTLHEPDLAYQWTHSHLL